MTTATTTRTARNLAAVYRGRLMSMAHDVCYPPDTRLFDEGGRADHFWLVESGTIALEMRVPGRHAAVIGTLGPGELLGWSWLYEPHRWRFGARTVGPVRAHEFDAEAVRRMCEDDPEAGRAIALWVGEAVVRRLNAARTRLPDLRTPYGSGARD
ncbi:cyclic nucleotide-binding domain-containing protein [Streptomyces sp. NPDC046909]|uniref:cyclic nucleotide-binding domain-containing protein n=1 Tax=Streptomyces sp. NPDC046909 TaxID=3155617 RepID=UPI0033EEFC1E